MLDPKQTDFLRLYLDPESETYSNALQSALKAGYSQEYAETITTKELKWLSEGVGKRNKLLVKAESNIEQLLDSSDERVKADITKFTAKTLGKKYYGEKDEKGQGDSSVTINILNYSSNGDNDSIQVQP